MTIEDNKGEIIGMYQHLQHVKMENLYIIYFNCIQLASKILFFH